MVGFGPSTNTPYRPPAAVAAVRGIYTDSIEALFLPTAKPCYPLPHQNQAFIRLRQRSTESNPSDGRFDQCSSG